MTIGKSGLCNVRRTDYIRKRRPLPSQTDGSLTPRSSLTFNSDPKSVIAYPMPSLSRSSVPGRRAYLRDTQGTLVGTNEAVTKSSICQGRGHDYVTRSFVGAALMTKKPDTYHRTWPCLIRQNSSNLAVASMIFTYHTSVLAI